MTAEQAGGTPDSDNLLFSGNTTFPFDSESIDAAEQYLSKYADWSSVRPTKDSGHFFQQSRPATGNRFIEDGKHRIAPVLTKYI